MQRTLADGSLTGLEFEIVARRLRCGRKVLKLERIPLEIIKSAASDLTRHIGRALN